MQKTAHHPLTQEHFTLFVFHVTILQLIPSLEQRYVIYIHDFCGFSDSTAYTEHEYPTPPEYTKTPHNTNTS